MLEVADFNTASGAAVQLWDNVKEDSQIWLLVEVAEGLYKLENKLTGKVLDVINAGSPERRMAAPVGLYRQGQPALDVGAGGGRPLGVRSKLSGRVLDIVGMSQENGARLQIWDDVDGENQAWKFTEVKAAKKKPAAKRLPRRERRRKKDGPARRKRRLQNAAVSPL